MATSPTEFEKPAGAAAAPSPNDPVIHVIPEKFYGAALKMKPAAPPPATPPPTAKPPGPAVPPPAVPPTGKLETPKPKGNKGLIIGIIGLVLLAVIAALFFVFNKGLQPKPAANANMPAPAPPPVCGDGKCELPETTATCPSDCPAPPPVCGDGKCDATESNATCPADCPPPAPVCGDKKCEAPENADTCPEDCGPPPPPVGGKDSDSDGLTDLEETTIYGTNIHDPDTDKDGYVDVNEVINLYDPAKRMPAKLIDNPGIKVFQGQGYSIFYPRIWTTRSEGAGADDAKDFFTASGGEFIEVMADPNADKKSLLDWYLAFSPSVKSADVTLFKTKQGYDEILSPDGFTAFVSKGQRVYVVAYNLGKAAEVQYKSTFAMMVNSLVLK